MKLKEISYEDAINLLMIAGRTDLLLARPIEHPEEMLVKEIREAANNGGKFFLPVDDENPKIIPKPKRPGRKRKNDIDTGKILALFRAGWSINQITDEMKLKPEDVASIIARGDSNVSKNQ